MARKTKKVDPLRQLLEGKRITKTVKTRRGSFEIEFPSPAALRQIEVRVAQMMAGSPAASFPEDTVRSFRVYATLDEVIVDSPEWWSNLESSEDCPDNALVGDLYRRYVRLYSDTQQALSTGKHDNGVGGGVAGSEDAAVGDDAFSGIAHGSEVSGT
ncbi:hypothetical protein CMI37_03140 [Candidatus Pacearchaeota archaeon]|nr:hypothetical protein [Candidatus Pacearchaeota archaeon]|tara:strand:+ start:250 stop:720 length:471 start_codon:yes stop_codon:yes gene_type:complete